MHDKSWLPCLSGWFISVALACWAAGCGGDLNTQGDATDDSGTDEVAGDAYDAVDNQDSTADTGVDPDGPDDPDSQDISGDGNGIECSFGAPFVEQFDKGCDGTGDCVIVYLSLDCCGTTLAAGVHASEEERFNAAWEECLLELPMCGCPSGPPVAEDGESTMELDSIEVECDGGKCMTFVP